MGGLELVSRYGELQLDHRIFDLGFANPSLSISEAQAWAFGLNWYLNKNLKFVLDYERTDYKDGGPLQSDNAPQNRASENTIFSRLQLVF